MNWNWLDVISAQLRAEAPHYPPDAEPIVSRQPAAERQRTPRPAFGGKVIHRSRVSADSAYSRKAFGGAISLLAPLSSDDEWRLANLDTKTLDKIEPARLMELLANLSPDVSRALWDFLRMVNPGYTLKAKRSSGSDAPSTAQAALKAIERTIADRHGDFNIPINRLVLATFLRGALCAEIVLDGRTTLDLATPDPASVLFRTKDDPLLGSVWEPYQWQDGKAVSLAIPTLRYIPVDPFPGSPYGRSLASPALFPTLFAIVLLHDVRRVVQQQGYPRLDIEVLLEKIRAAMPENAEDDPEEYQRWINDTIGDISAFYEQLEPDDAYVHTDAIKVNKPVGAVDASSLAGVDKILLVLERWAVRALKTMPLLMGTTDGASEANANRQWEIYAAGIKSIQHLAENLLSYLLTQALQAQGVPAIAELRFSELRAAELLRDAQTESMQIANTVTKYNQGWIDQDEASMAITGHAPAEKEPRRVSAPAPVASTTDAATTNPDPGSNR